MIIKVKNVTSQDNKIVAVTRVKAVHRDARVLQLLGQLHAVQHVGQLGLRVGLPFIVAVLPVDVVPVHLPVLVGQARDNDDAGRRHVIILVTMANIDFSYIQRSVLCWVISPLQTEDAIWTSLFERLCITQGGPTEFYT